MKVKASILIGISLLLLALGGAWFAIRSPSNERFHASITRSLSGEGGTEQFERALTKRNFKFPEDFGAHPGFQTEWWYYTGNVKSTEGRHFGYQLTIFRRALAGEPQTEGNASKWRTSQIYFAHFAISDIQGETFYSFEKFSRGALSLAGAQASPYRVWVEDWQIEENDGVVSLKAAEGDVSLNLTLTALKPVVLQGDQGLSQKGSGIGNASYYFSQTRLDNTGTITIAGGTHDVKGTGWLDREWSTSVLERGATGWDWFALQLDDQTEIMVFQIRTENGGISPASAGVFVTEKGSTKHLSKGDFSIGVTSQWRSPHTGVVYPSGWDIRIPDLDLFLTVKPLLSDQEHRHSFRYWEGAVEVRSRQNSGVGYVELTGY